MSVVEVSVTDGVQGRSGKAYADWLTDQGVNGVDVKVTIVHAALDPFRGYANAIRDELPEAVAVLDAFHVVKLAGNALDEVRRTLLTGEEYLTDRQRQRLALAPGRNFTCQLRIRESSLGLTCQFINQRVRQDCSVCCNPVTHRACLISFSDPAVK